uniref:Thioredoxin-dependent peroxide reductase, mitochondrial n=1 Tax=Takifugu rubripes TaxID=31033 RepID=A0A674P0Z2_TAKRU
GQDLKGFILSTALVAAGGLKVTPACQRVASATARALTGPALQRACFSTNTSRWAPAVTQPAPAFKGTAVHNGEFKEMSLADFKGKYLVLFFYPLDFTFVCPTEIIAFSDKANEFHDVNCEVVGVSVDSHFTHLAWINTPRKTGGLGHIHIPLLSDLTKQISRDYGVLLEGPGAGFLLVKETLRLVKAFQFVETHGEVCPASWTPESPTIKPTPEGSKEYFGKVN